MSSDVEVTDGCGTLYSHRRIMDGKDFVFIRHNENTSVTATVRLPRSLGQVTALDPSTGAQTVPETCEAYEGVSVKLDFSPYGAYYPVVDPEENPAAPTPKPVFRELTLTEFTASIDRGNTDLSLIHEFIPVVTDRGRVILRKGRFDDPTHPDVLDVTVLSEGRTVACREVKGTFTVKYDDVKAVELSLSAQTIDGVWV